MKLLSTTIFLLTCMTSVAQSWVPKADFGGVGRHRGSGFSIGNKGYVGIGHMNGSGVNIVYTDWWQYDPASNSWTQKADYANGTPNYGAVSFSTSTKGYVGGGTAFASSFYCYDPVANTWTEIAPCPVTASNQAAFSINEKGYVISNSDLYEYNPAMNNWTLKQSLPAFANAWSSAFVIGNSAYFKTGNQLFEYKASQNEWLPRAPFPGLATGGSSAFAIYNKGYIVSGYSGVLSAVTKEVWQYNPATNTWMQFEDFEGAARRFSVGFAIGNRGYIGIGTNGINFNDFWSFDQYSETDELLPEVTCTTYPNPSPDKVHFRLNGAVSNSWKLQIHAADGHLIHSAEYIGNEAIFDGSQLPAGTYFYQISSEGKNSYNHSFQLLEL